MQAKLEFPPTRYYGPRPLLRDQDGELVRDGQGNPVPGDPELVVDEAGNPRLMPSPVDRLTEEDWTAAGGRYRVPRSPSTVELTVALFDRAMDIAQDAVYRLLALFTIDNRDLGQARTEGRLDELLASTVENLLDDAYLDELLELAAAVGELIDTHLMRKAKAIGGRLDPFLALLGIDAGAAKGTSPTSAPTSATDSSATETTTDGSSSSRPSSSTASPASTPDGPPTSSSTPPTTSSSSSDASSTSTPASDTAPRSSPRSIEDRPQA